jgi:phosphoribosyl 1,2-cyclic phosphodiesterase
MEYTYFPVTLEQLDATIRFHDLVESQFSIARARIVTQYLNHPALTLGYRLESDGATVVYIADHEPHARGRPEASRASSPAGGPLHREDQRHVAFLTGADLVIHDAQYTVEEYDDRIGWGHSAMPDALAFAALTGIGRLVPFHHDPTHDDAMLDRIDSATRASRQLPFELLVGTEGATFDV